MVLITGASRGLGRAMATAFAGNGYAVGINYAENDAEAKQTAERVQKAGAPALLLKANVRASGDVTSMMEKVSAEWGRLDVLVNNAGAVRNKTIFKMSDDDWWHVLSVNLDGAFYCTRSALPLMRAQKDGTILNVTSYLAGRGARGAANYSAAKAGLIALTKSTALEEGRYNIRANALLPGYHVTDMNRDVWDRYQKEILEDHLLGRLPDKEEMARFVVELAKLKSVTGQVFAFESRIL